MFHDEFLYDKAWIPTRAIYENYHLYAACLHWVLSNFVDPYERFVMLLKSRSRTHHPHMQYSYTGVGSKTCFPFRSTQKCVISTLGVNTKNMLDSFFIHQINAPSSCYYLSKVCCRKRSLGYAKVIHKKGEKEREKKRKMDNCLRYLK